MVAEAEKHAAGGWNEAGHHDQYPTCDVVVAERLGLGSRFRVRVRVRVAVNGIAPVQPLG